MLVYIPVTLLIVRLSVCLSVVSYSKMTVLWKIVLFISRSEGLGKHLLGWVYSVHIQVAWKLTARLDVEPRMGLGKILVKGD
jgi:hypothetical protein